MNWRIFWEIISIQRAKANIHRSHPSNRLAIVPSTVHNHTRVYQVSYLLYYAIHTSTMKIFHDLQHLEDVLTNPVVGLLHNANMDKSIKKQSNFEVSSK